MATIKSLIERIETRLFMLSGLDVQIHAEGQLEEMLRGVYATLFDDFWHPEFTYYAEKTLDGVTGEIVEDISDIVLRYKDINSFYMDDDFHQIPRVTPSMPLTSVTARSVCPSPNKQKVFKIIPTDTSGTIKFWYRTRIADSVWDDQEYNTEIMFDDEVLMYGVVYEWLVNDGSNDTAASEYKNKFMQRQQQLRNSQWQIPLSKTEGGVFIPTKWK